MSIDANTKFCQSCAMPLQDETVYGTNADQSKNDSYCCYCYKDGKFTADVDMEGMIAMCVPHMVAAHPELTPESAARMMRDFLPKLERWR